MISAQLDKKLRASLMALVESDTDSSGRKLFFTDIAKYLIRAFVGKKMEKMT